MPQFEQSKSQQNPKPELLATMRRDPFAGSPELQDVVVVGGGIVGAGIARDAAMRGLRVTLVEQADFAEGTSSRSSRLLHGGLRYLAQGRLLLVREASREKLLVQRLAPHLVAPLAFLFPTRRGSYWSKWKLRAGVKLYDLLCSGRNFAPSEVLSARETLARLPALNPTNLTGAVRYYDGLTADARLVLDTLRSAAQQGATCRNYLRLENALRSGNHWVCSLRNRLNQSWIELSTRSVVNATGPWSDMLPHSRTRLRRTKGVHLVIPRQRLPLPDAVVMPEGRRILFAIPWGRRVILGTSDTDYDGPLDAPRCEAEDMQYVLSVVNAAFPEAGLTAGDVTATWAGIRPLIADPRGGPSDISRHHEIHMAADGWWDVTGGKLTTYRLIAEQTVDQVCRALRFRAGPCRSAYEPLLDPQETSGVSGIEPPDVSQQVVHHYCTREWAVHLNDVMIRRTSWHYYVDHPADVAHRVAQWMAAEMGWDEETIQSELKRYLAAT
jgi:glycerol-3-phosphate dehydrogenase